MTKDRLVAFSDGIIAVIITIMVLELRVPSGGDLAALKPMLPVFLAYVLSFVNIAIYWNNHHHMLYAVDRIDGRVMWSNLHLLFWLSLIPFTTAWVGRNHLAALPTAIYGVVLIMAAIAYTMLQVALIAAKRARIGARTRRRLRRKRPRIHRAIRGGDRQRISESMGCRRVLCCRSRHMARARSAHREKNNGAALAAPCCVMVRSRSVIS